MLQIFNRSTAMAFGFAGAFIVVASTSLMYFLKYLVVNLDTDMVDRGSGAAITFGIFVIITGIFIYTAAYLEIFGPDVIRRESDIDAIKASYDEEINNLKERLKEIPQPRTDEQIESSVSKVFETKIKSSIAERMANGAADIAKETLLKTYAPTIYNDKSFQRASSIYDSAIHGMQERIRSQEKNAKVSLTYGVGFALAGLGALAFFVIQPYFSREILLRTANKSPDWNLFWIDFIPRLSFVLIFESIAFFFLKTYRDDNAMIRYFRNEITNVEEKSLALFSAILFADDKTLSGSISKMMATERNFVIKKGQRTIGEANVSNNDLMVEKVVDRLTSALTSNRLVKNENLGLQADQSNKSS